MQLDGGGAVGGKVAAGHGARGGAFGVDEVDVLRDGPALRVSRRFWCASAEGWMDGIPGV